MQKISFTTWLTRGTYPRLYLPIIAIILLVSVVRYDLMIKAEVKEVQLERQDKLQHMQHYVVPQLLAQSSSGDTALVQALLDAEARLNPDILSLRWQYGGAALAANLPPGQISPVPAWFQRLTKLGLLEKTWPVSSADDGLPVTLSVQLGAAHAQERVWNTVGSQLPISALNIFTILFLLTLLVRANARMLQRLDAASSRFRSGQLQTRMAETGTLEARASARTFNLMAGEIQRLVKSLEHTKQQQEEQLHFTRQLVDALPLPVFVRTSDGTCLRVNKAWERLFGTTAATVVGNPMHSDFVPIEPMRASTERRTVPRQSNEVLVRSGAFDVREMSYFKAAFSTTDGEQGGTISALVDITERKLAQDELIAEKERAEVTLSSIGDGVITTDMAGSIESINEVAQYLTGHNSIHAVGRPLVAVFNLDSTSQALPYGTTLRALHATTKRLHAVNQVLVHRCGERYPIEFTAAPIRKGSGPQIGCVLVFRDISETRDLQQQISWQATHDALTGLNNRAALAERLTHAVFQARQDDTLLAVCMLDLDHFQAINEQHGNPIGDLLLKEVALRLQDIAPDQANIARLGGDEFVVLLPGHTDVASIHTRAQQLLQRLAQPYAIGDQQITLTASLGISIFPLDNANPDTLMRHADQAMCQAKQTGRNRLHQFDAQNDLNIQTQHSQITRIAYGLRSGEMRLFYQPKVNMRSGHILGYEALMRWMHPERGLVSPGEFLPLIEHTDLIIEAGNWALHKAMAQLDEWVQQGHGWMVSVNIAARHFHHPDFVETMRQLLLQYPRVPAALLELEILESAALQDVAHMREVMQACQTLGVQFALDDFGTGFSSLSYLKQLPAETIKIDRTFVDGLLDNADDRTLVSAIVGLSRAFDRSVIAEGVETAEQAGKLLSLGCELGQGYGICKPMPLSRVQDWAAQYARAFEPA